jgi:hypothetical protein
MSDDDPGEAFGVKRAALVRLFESRRFEFPDETYGFEVLGPDVRQELHQHALASAERFGIDEYAEFFAGDEVPSAPAVRPDSSLLSGADLEALRDYLHVAGRAAA